MDKKYKIILVVASVILFALFIFFFSAAVLYIPSYQVEQKKELQVYINKNDSLIHMLREDVERVSAILDRYNLDTVIINDVTGSDVKEKRDTNHPLKTKNRILRMASYPPHSFYILPVPPQSPNPNPPLEPSPHPHTEARSICGFPSICDFYHRDGLGSQEMSSI